MANFNININRNKETDFFDFMMSIKNSKSGNLKKCIKKIVLNSKEFQDYQESKDKSTNIQEYCRNFYTQIKDEQQYLKSKQNKRRKSCH